VILLLMVAVIGDKTKPPAPEFVVESIEFVPKVLDDELDQQLIEETPDEIIEELVDDQWHKEDEIEPQPTDDPVDPVGPISELPPIEGPDMTEMPLEDVMASLTAVDYSTPYTTDAISPRLTASGRDQAVGKYGGSPEGQRAVLRALAWLAEVQQPNGSWKGPNDVACTGMALLVFLAHGETPLSETYGDTVRTSIIWLSTAMKNTPENGNCGGRAYSHGIATYALAEAYGMTRIPMLRTAMDKGLARIIGGQQAGGGFDYNYRGAGDGGRWDLSVGGWQYQALKAGYMSGSQTPGLEAAITKSVSFIKNEAYANKKFGYASPGSGGNMTGVGTVALQLMGERDSAQVRSALDTIGMERLALYRNIKDRTDWTVNGGKSLYGWYYDTQAMFNLQGKEWRQWQKVFEPVLVKYQHPKGYWAADGHGFNDKDDAGRILSTCWATLQLEVYYRYLPTYDARKVAKKHVAALDLDSDLIIR